MKIFNQTINLKKVLIVLLAVLVLTSLLLYILTLFRKYGDVDINSPVDLIATYTFAIVAILLTLLCYKWFSKRRFRGLSKSLLAFLSSFLAFISLFLIFDFFTYSQEWTYHLPNRVLNAFAIAMIWHVQVSGITLGYLHLTESSQAKADLQVTQKEKENLQLRILRKNLEPHFLFNNLSVLSGLAKHKPEQIDGFIDDFSEVYRYYLQQNKQDVVHLSEELTFIQQYMNLMQRRFGKAYQIQVNIEETEGYIIPCAIQLCIENAIKHNKGSETQPLLIRIERKDNHLIIQNPLNAVDFTVSTHTGNSYLSDQYQILFEQTVQFHQTAHHYTVNIPIIE